MVSRLRSMGSLVTILLTAHGIYALITGVFLLSENRRPEATFAWLLVFIFLPVVGLVVYLFFGRSRKAFSKRETLWRQNIEPAAVPLLDPVLSIKTHESRNWNRTAQVTKS